MPNDPTILFAGGGTGGHLYPGISVALALKENWPEARPLFLVTRREIDRVILRPTGFDFMVQPIVPPVKTVSGLLAFWKNWRETKDLVRGLLRERNVVGALGLGGYAAGVAVKLAAEKHIPCAIINPDVIPGKANQYLMKSVSAVCCQFEQTRERVASGHQGKLKITGCPIRPEIAGLPSREDGIARLELDPSLRTLVITGASLGAQTVNEAVIEALPSLNLQGWQVLHLAGRDHAASVSSAYVQRQASAASGQRQFPVKVVDFTPEMADVWAVADLVICRSGGSTCAELTACGVPSILMPYPYHKDMHQRANAKVLADAGGAVILDDEKDAGRNAAKLRPLLESLLHDSTRRQAMAAAARGMARPDAAAQVAAVLKTMPDC